MTLSDCRDKGFDNGNNMGGKYKGAQAIREGNYFEGDINVD